MAKKILVMGLPGSGKSTLANKLFQKLASAEHLNADKVREMFNDWDFSDEGRLRQAKRMSSLAKDSKAQWAVLDFVCPKREYRDIVDPDILVWMDTIDNSRYDDTNKSFEHPIDELTKIDFRFTTFDSDKYAQEIVSMLQPFDWQKPTVQMLGRWQPWHPGHRALFERCVAKTGQVAIQVRDVAGATGGAGQDDNPFDFEKVRQNIIADLSDKYTYGNEYIVMLVPNIVNITYGRGVGYTFEQEVFDDDTHNISATNIRAQMRKDGAL
jgi:adenylylsulfate kinase